MEPNKEASRRVPFSFNFGGGKKKQLTLSPPKKDTPKSKRQKTSKLPAEVMSEDDKAEMFDKNETDEPNNEHFFSTFCCAC
jgi:hypothetical protein